jgi:polysaccharide biosynthesis protein PslG
MTDPRDSDSPFGVLDFLAWDHERFGHHYTLPDVEKSAALMREAGVRFVRFDFLWNDIEPKAGQFQFEKYDRIVDTLVRHGICVEGLLVYSPEWSGRRWYDAPDIVAYCRYAGAVVNRFKDRIRHWEIWHEPDNPAFWIPQDNMQAYGRLIKHVYPLLKSIDPTCVIHLGGMSRSLPMSLKYVYEAGAQPFFDVVNIHPFSNPLQPGALDAVRHMYQFVYRAMRDYGDALKPIWFTEIGCPGMINPKSTANWWLGANPTERVQAEWVSALYTEALRWPNVEKIFWCFFRDTETHFGSGSDYDGLIRRDFTRKPSFEAYRQIAAQHPAKTV